jgi:U3 small nucleolar RNA-associated protein 15
MLEELSARAGLQAALSSREPAALLPLLRHLAKHITDPRHSAVLSGVAARLLDIYAPVVHTHEEVDACLAKLRDALKLEVRLHESLLLLSGVLEPILGAALAASASAPPVV